MDSVNTLLTGCGSRDRFYPVTAGSSESGVSIYVALCERFLGGTISAWAFENNEYLERFIDLLMRQPGHCGRQWFDEDTKKRR